MPVYGYHTISYFRPAGYVLWFDAYVMDANNLVNKLIKTPPLDKQVLRSKVNELIGEYTKGKDAGKLRIIEKNNTDYIEREVKSVLMNSSEYISVVENIKHEIRTAQYRAAVHANTDMLLLYHDIGCIINEHKSWGNKFIDNLATDIRTDFPGSKGYSVRNLKYMSKFAETYPDREFVQTVSAQIPWSHNITIIEKVKDPEQRIWYIQKTAENGWSYNVLIHQIESGLYQRQVLVDKVSNFESHLPSPQSELAVQTMKDPYVFDFIPFREDMIERDIEQALVRDITKLLLELGTGFAFLGNQYHLNIGGDDFYIDLLFYNLNLRCYVVIELKTGDIKPEYAGQLNFYLSAVDGTLKKKKTILRLDYCCIRVKTTWLRNIHSRIFPNQLERANIQ